MQVPGYDDEWTYSTDGVRWRGWVGLGKGKLWPTRPKNRNHSAQRDSGTGGSKTAKNYCGIAPLSVFRIIGSVRITRVGCPAAAAVWNSSGAMAARLASLWNEAENLARYVVLETSRCDSPCDISIYNNRPSESNVNMWYFDDRKKSVLNGQKRRELTLLVMNWPRQKVSSY